MKKRNLLVRGIIILVVTLIGVIIIVRPHHRPTKSDFTWAGLKANLRQNIHLGLDLQGGSHLVMHVKVEEALQQLTESSADAAFTEAKAKNLPVTDRSPVPPADPTVKNPPPADGKYRFTLTTSDPSRAKEIQDAVAQKIDINDWDASVSGNTLTWTLKSKYANDFAAGAVQQALKIIDSRINAVGVVEPTLQTHGAAGSNQILLQMPGIDDPERVKKILVGESRLELVHVVSAPSPQSVQKYATREEALQSLGVPPGGTPPPNKRVLPYSERDEPIAGGNQAPNQPKAKSWVVVEYPAIINGSELRDAQGVSATGGQNDYQIHFSLKKSGAEKFGTWTAANINQYMGVVLNDEVKSIAYIKSQITDSGQIDGKFSKESSEDLALTLRSGALPAPIEYLEERTVGPSLGNDSIRAGVTASIAGLAFVIFFILFYYRGSGVNAVVALILNMILMIAGLIIFGATLTLPGIAGIILTIGMAVDSNVLVFERIREELRAGKAVPTAIEQGFAHAFVTIIDTHITTIISSLFLFVFGTGPIRGFAVTLILGLVINLFTAVYVSRTIFLWLLSRKTRMETLSI
jgi:preprotein translocase subunit SecD